MDDNQKNSPAGSPSSTPPSSTGVNPVTPTPVTLAPTPQKPKQEYFFPQYGKTVIATSREEAEAQIANLLKSETT